MALVVGAVGTRRAGLRGAWSAREVPRPSAGSRSQAARRMRSAVRKRAQAGDAAADRGGRSPVQARRHRRFGDRRADGGGAGHAGVASGAPSRCCAPKTRDSDAGSAGDDRDARPARPGLEAHKRPDVAAQRVRQPGEPGPVGPSDATRTRFSAAARSRGPTGAVAHDRAELRPRGDLELGEDPVRVRTDGAVRQVQPFADLAVGRPVGGHLGYLQFLGGEQIVRLDRAAAACFTRGPQLLTGQFAPRRGAEAAEGVPATPSARSPRRRMCMNQSPRVASVCCQRFPSRLMRALPSWPGARRWRPRRWPPSRRGSGWPAHSRPA
jgi:hypothetical protein